MESFWDILKDPSNRNVLTWIGSGIAVLGSTIWAVFKFIVKGKTNHFDYSVNVKASSGGIATGRDVHIDTVNVGSNREFGKLRELRYMVFVATRDFVTKTVSNGKVDRIDLQNFRREIVKDPFLFEKDLKELLDKIYEKAAKLMFAQTKMKQPRTEKERAEMCELDYEILTWLGELNLEEAFKEYLDLQK